MQKQMELFIYLEPISRYARRDEGEEMKYEVNFKCFGWITAKNPRNARRIIENILADSHIFLIHPSFKTKKSKIKEKKWAN